MGENNVISINAERIFDKIYHDKNIHNSRTKKVLPQYDSVYGKPTADFIFYGDRLNPCH